MDEPKTTEEVKVPEPSSPAPKKRELTEAQRLAFLKGREKRMLNIQRRKEEKEEAAKLAAEKTEEPVLKPIVKQHEKTPSPPENKDAYDDATAQKIADYVYLKLRYDAASQAPPQRKPRKPSKPKIKEQPPREVETPAPSAPPPKKIISWC